MAHRLPVILAVLTAAACTAPTKRAPMTTATLARRVDDPAQAAPWSRSEGRLISISAVDASEMLPEPTPPWVRTNGSVARPPVIPAAPVLGRVPRKRTVMATSDAGAGETVACRTALLRVTGDQLIIDVDSQGSYALPRTDGQLPRLGKELEGVCAARVAADGMPYAQLLAVMDEVFRAGIADIAVAAGGHVKELSLPGIVASRYAAKRRRGKLGDAPVVVVGSRHVALRTRKGVVVMAPKATLDEPAPYQDLHEQLTAAREAMPADATTLVLRARRDTPGVVIARIVAAAGAAGFVDVLFTAGE
jgi:hypothetical protein